MPDRIKVLEIITRLDRGGSTDMVLALCEWLNRERFDVTLVAGPSRDNDLAALARELGIRNYICPTLVRPIRPFADARALRTLETIIRSERPDIIHTHTSKAGALGRVAARRAGVPVIHTTHGHVFYGYGRLSGKLFALIERRLAPLAKRITVLTDIERDEHLERGIGRPEQFVTIPSGIDLSRFRVDSTLREKTRSSLGLTGPAVCWAGRFARVKAPGLFVEACAKVARDVPEAIFLMAGDGELRTETEQLARKLGIYDRMKFLGHRRDMPAVLNACDAFVLSSLNEGLGLAAIESMACGVPIVATNVGGVPEVLQSGRAGLLVPPNADAIAAGIIALIRDSAWRSALCEAGLVRVRDFDIANVVSRFERLYEETIRCGG